MEEFYEFPKIILDRDEMNVSQLLHDIKLELSSCTGEDLFKKYEELQKCTEKIDLSVLNSNDYENATSPSTPKRRKTSKAGLENNDGPLPGKNDKYLEEIKKQIDNVKKALNIIYEMENRSFKSFISKKNNAHRHVISRVPFFKKITEHAQALPLWVGIDDAKSPPPLCGAVKADDNYVADIGDLVAAWVKKDVCILAEVIAYNPIRREYTVDDIYEEKKTEQILSCNKVVPLPRMRAHPEFNPEALFQKGDLVLALYPGTTCFYRAIVGELPANPEDPYKLLFEDENYDDGYSHAISVHQLYVIHNMYYGKEGVR